MNGSDASIQRRAYAGKSTLTASTLLLGSPISPSTTTIGQFVFGEPEVTTDDLLAAKGSGMDWTCGTQCFRGPNMWEQRNRPQNLEPTERIRNSSW